MRPGTRILVLSVLTALTQTASFADVGIVVYESKGVDARRTGAGHLALISTRLCASGITQLRSCDAGEEPGVVVTRYGNLASGYDGTLFAIPLRDHFKATADVDDVPALSSGGDLESLQREYWRSHLRSYLRPLTRENYQLMRDKLDAFDAGRTVRRAVTLEYLMNLLGPRKKADPTWPIASVDPATHELIPEGRWREAIGVQHMRGSVIITAKTSPEQEFRLIKAMEVAHRGSFNVLNHNCSDFVAEELLEVFGDAGFRMRPRTLRIADAWITSPITVATSFVDFARRKKLGLNLQLMPMLAGTRRPTARVTSIARGALVPDASQGKMAFSIRIYFNLLNPLIGLTAFGVDKASGLIDLQDLAHERGSAALSALADARDSDSTTARSVALALAREQVRVFGAASCWAAKRKEFAGVQSEAAEKGLISRSEQSLLLKMDRPYLLPRFYEQSAKMCGNGSTLTAGLRGCPDVALRRNVAASSFDVRVKRVAGESLGGDPPAPSRSELREMAGSASRATRATAFRVMTALINYDLSSSPASRRTSEAFDEDWELFRSVSEANGLVVANGQSGDDSVAECSCRKFDAGDANGDVFQEGRSFRQGLLRESRRLVYGANR